jgi:hypothetical protein
MDICKHSFSFAMVVALDNMVYPNIYDLTYSFRVATADYEQQHIAFSRIKHFIEHRVTSSLCISLDHPKFKNLSKLDNNIYALPCDPVDFPIACTLLHKFTAITHGNFEIQTLQLKSMVGDYVEYILTADDHDEMNLFLEGMPADKVWWNDSDPNTNKTQPYVSWDAVDLSWPDDTAAKKPATKMARVIQFNPVVIEGGKEKS